MGPTIFVSLIPHFVFVFVCFICYLYAYYIGSDLLHVCLTGGIGIAHSPKVRFFKIFFVAIDSLSDSQSDVF